jgi:DNA-binding CsgD family transcriptional regulator
MSSVAYRDDRTDDLAPFSVFSTDLSETSAEPKFAPQPFVPQVALLRTGLQANPLSDLTARELQTLSLLAQGKPYSRIAEDLNVSYKTVVNACSQLKQKLNAKNLPELIRLAVQLVPAES